MQIPLIDYQKLIARDLDALRNLKRGVSATGFLIVENTSIPLDQIQSLISSYHRFFLLSDEVKSPYDMAKTGSNRGWGRAGGEQVNPNANPDYKQVFDVGAELAPDHPLSQQTYYALNLWPDVVGFKQDVTAYYNAAFDVAMTLLGAIADAVDLPSDFFTDKFNPPMALLRANFYPQKPINAGAKDFGIAEHTDYGCLTLLAADGVPGLEIQLESGKWIPINAKPGQFVINFGEMIEQWSNGQIRATLHRVVEAPAERISIPFFFNPAYDTNIAPMGSGETARAGDWLTKRYNETYVHKQVKA